MTVSQTLDVVHGLVNNMEEMMEGACRFPLWVCARHEPPSGRWQGIDRRYPTGPRCALLFQTNEYHF